MTVSWLLKPSFISILVLLMTLQLSACNSNGPAATTEDNFIASDPGSTDDPGSSSNTAILTDITLSWIAPSEREDNKPISLSEIAGYRIYYGTTENDYPNSVEIDDGNAESYTFRGLSTGIYFFVLTTLDTEGRESQYSDAVQIVV
jgi:hypothetical protein